MITSERRIGSRHGRTRSGPRTGFRPPTRSAGGPGAWPARRIYAGRRNALVAERAFFFGAPHSSDGDARAAGALARGRGAGGVRGDVGAAAGPDGGVTPAGAPRPAASGGPLLPRLEGDEQLEQIGVHRAGLALEARMSSARSTGTADL
jgi:hypothetical protein